MKKIYKYILEITDETTIEMPIGAEILSVQVQGSKETKKAMLWAYVDDEQKNMQKRHFRVLCTGESITDYDSLTFIATIQIHDGDYVFHIFEKKYNK